MIRSLYIAQYDWLIFYTSHDLIGLSVILFDISVELDLIIGIAKSHSKFKRRKIA